jgi:myb proto-oncogene protein
VSIAAALGTGRSAFQCLQRHQSSLTVTVATGPWSDLEDAALLKAVQQHGAGQWQAIAASLGHSRTSVQCMGRWLKHLNPAIRKGRWDPAETQ